MTVPYLDEDFLLPDTMVVAKIPSIVFLVPRVGIIATMSARLFQQAFRTEPFFLSVMFQRRVVSTLLWGQAPTLSFRA